MVKPERPKLVLPWRKRARKAREHRLRIELNKFVRAEIGRLIPSRISSGGA